MKFEEVRDNIITILGNAEGGRYQTIGFQRQSSAAEEAENNKRMVSVYYKSGAFDKRSGSINGPVQHDMTFNIELFVSMPSSADLNVLNNPDSTSAQLQTALMSAQEANLLVDRNIDNFASIIYQILMDARNIDLSFKKGVISNRWVDQLEKDNPVERGELVVLTGSMRLTCRVKEDVTGDLGISPDPVIYDSSLNINEDPVQQTGAQVTNT